MSSTDTETQAAPTPVQASNASAALPGAGGASASYGGGSSATPASATTPPGTSEPYSTMTTPTQVGVPNPQARPALLGKDARSKDDYAGSDIVVQPAVKAGGPAAIEYDIRDRTTATGMQPQAIAQLNAAAEFAGQAGLSRIVVVAGRGPGHKSHGAGTEWDLMGYNADGSKWTREQRVAVAAGARSAGATRFGFYEYGKSFPTADGRLHIGSRGPAATWGAGGYTGGAKSRAYTNEAERAFSTAFYAGQNFDYAPFLGHPATMTAEAQNQPGTMAYAGDPFGVSASKAAAGIPNPPPRPVPTSALAFAEAAPEAADPTRQVLSTASLATQVLDRGRVLERGARGAAATEWQTFLNMHGFTDASGRQLVTDGDFGRRTREATKAFQEWAQIGVDGKVGPETLSAALYLIDPTSAPMPGKVAYDDGAVAAKKIIAPAEVDMPAYRPRPERGAGIPDPRTNPRRSAPSADWTNVDALTEVDANGDLVIRDSRTKDDVAAAGSPPARAKPSMPLRRTRQGDGYFGPADVGQAASEYRSVLLDAGAKPGPGLDRMVDEYARDLRSGGRFRYASGLSAAEIGKAVSDHRDALAAAGVPPGERLDRMVTAFEAEMKRTILRDQSARAAGAATRQRLREPRTKDDRFRPVARDTRSQDEIMLVRSSEAVREFARGIGDSYRQVIQGTRLAPARGRPPPADQSVTGDILLRVAPSPAETVTDTYAFGS